MLQFVYTSNFGHHQSIHKTACLFNHLKLGIYSFESYSTKFDGSSVATIDI